jgi:hypothetical protein
VITKIKLDSNFTENRLETGPVEFEYANGKVDWPGMFIRGDDCFGYVLDISRIISAIQEGNVKNSNYYCQLLSSLQNTLAESIVGFNKKHYIK